MNVDDIDDDYQEEIEQVEDDEVIEDEQETDIDESNDAEEGQEEDDGLDLDYSFDEQGDDEEGDPFAGQPAPPWLKDVRNENRELKRKVKQLEQLEQRNGKQEQQQALREKPTLETHDYDSDAYEQDYAAWLNEKQQHESVVKAEQEKYQHYNERYKSSVDAVRAKAKDYDEIEQSIVNIMPEQRQALVKMLVDSPAKMVYALGKSPEQMERLSKLDDVQFAKEIVLLEIKMSSTTKNRNSNKPKPKTHELEGAAGGGDTQLAKLEAEADKTGDRSKVHAYKRKQK